MIGNLHNVSLYTCRADTPLYIICAKISIRIASMFLHSIERGEHEEVKRGSGHPSWMILLCWNHLKCLSTGGRQRFHISLCWRGRVKFRTKPPDPSSGLEEVFVLLLNIYIDFRYAVFLFSGHSVLDVTSRFESLCDFEHEAPICGRSASLSRTFGPSEPS